MAGRRAKPIGLHVLDGKKHFTKKEIAERKASEIRFGDKVLAPPKFIKRDKAAMRKWKEVVALYADVRVDFVSSSDVGHLARYCKLYSEYLDLVEHRERVRDMDPFKEKTDNFAGVAAEVKDKLGAQAAYKLWQKIEYIVSVDGLMALDAAINKKAAILTAMEDRLFLNPLAKVRTVPKQKKQEKDPLEEEGFGNV